MLVNLAPASSVKYINEKNTHLFYLQNTHTNGEQKLGTLHKIHPLHKWSQGLDKTGTEFRTTRHRRMDPAINKYIYS